MFSVLKFENTGQHLGQMNKAFEKAVPTHTEVMSLGSGHSVGQHTS